MRRSSIWIAPLSTRSARSSASLVMEIAIHGIKSIAKHSATMEANHCYIDMEVLSEKYLRRFFRRGGGRHFDLGECRQGIGHLWRTRGLSWNSLRNGYRLRRAPWMRGIPSRWLSFFPSEVEAFSTSTSAPYANCSQLSIPIIHGTHLSFPPLRIRKNRQGTGKTLKIRGNSWMIL